MPVLRETVATTLAILIQSITETATTVTAATSKATAVTKGRILPHTHIANLSELKHHNAASAAVV